MSDELVFLAMFSIAAVVAVLSKRLNFPYTIALVLAGLVLGSTDAFEPVFLTKELLYAIFLPGLLFEAAFHLELKQFGENKLAILSLAIPGVACAMGLTAALILAEAPIAGFGEDFEFIHALVFASLIAATDPIAVVGLFKSLGAPKRLAVLVEGESLFNDGTAVVFFVIVLTFATGGELTAGQAVMTFLTTAGGGALVGGIIGFAASRAIQQIDDPMIEITATTVAAYGSFALAENFHLSGVIATVIAGMLCGNFGARTGMSPSTRIAAESFWEYLAFVLNSFVFLLIGLQVQLSGLIEHWLPILLTWIAVTVGRGIIVSLATVLLAKTKERIPWRYSAVLTWGGLRGALSMVLVMGLANDFPHRQLLIDLTFGVVFLSIVVQGATMAPLLRKLGVIGGQHDKDEYEYRRGQVLIAAEALEALDELREEQFVRGAVLDNLEQEYKERVDSAEKALDEFRQRAGRMETEDIEAATRRLLMIERDRAHTAHHEGIISGEALDRLLGDIDARVVALTRDDSEPSH